MYYADWLGQRFVRGDSNADGKPLEECNTDPTTDALECSRDEPCE